MRHIKLFEEFEDKTIVKEINDLWDKYNQMVENGDLDKDSSIAIDRLFETAIDYYTHRDQGKLDLKSHHRLGVLDLENELIFVKKEIEKEISEGYYNIDVAMSHIIDEILEIVNENETP
jgi:hypothetical protein